MPDVFLKRQSESELHFRHSFLGGWIFAAVGCVILVFGIRYAGTGAARWIAVVMGALFVAIGFGGALWRYDLTLDLFTRSYRRRRGFWPSPRVLRGSLDELEGVVLTRRWQRSENSNHAIWSVRLAFGSWDRPVSFFETTSEQKGHRKLEEIARRLQTPAIDRTGDQEIIRAPDELDRSVVDRECAGGVASSITIEEPPAGGRIEWTKSEIGAPMIVLPALGFNVGALFMALVGLPFMGYGVIALASALGWSWIEVSGTLTAKWLVGGVFVVIGMLCCAGAVFVSVAREVVRADGDALLITLLAFGTHYRRRRLPWRDIEEISIKPSKFSQSRRSGAKRTEIVLRTDDVVVRMASDLSAENQAWLCRTLLALARR